MNRLMMTAVAMLAVATSAVAKDAAPAAEAEKKPDTGLKFNATLDIYSAYIWRGCVLTDRPVWQPGGTVSYTTGGYGKLSANVWANFDMTDRNECRVGGGLNTINYTVSYLVDVGPFSLEAGHIWYTYPRANGKTSEGKDNYFPSTAEVYGGVSYNNSVVTPFVRLYGGYQEVNGLYGVAGLNKKIALTDRLTLGSELSLGAGNDHYMEFYFGGNDQKLSAGLVDLNASLTASYALTDNLSIGAKLAWVSLLDSDARDSEAWHDNEQLWGGVNLSASF